MCGIVGYIGQKPAANVILESLRCLEYRGYDSAGIALVPPRGPLRLIRARGRLDELARLLEPHEDCRLGIGHTRWATHGKPTVNNAHPHRSQDGKVAVVHNGIIENCAELREELRNAGYQLVSETDTECIPMLIAHYSGQGMNRRQAFLKALERVEGVYAVACAFEDEPHRMLVARSGPPLVIGVGRGEHFVASDVAPLLRHTRDVIYLEDGDYAEVTPFRVEIFDGSGEVRHRKPQRITWDPEAVELGPYRHYMEKEIYEQPQSIRNTLQGRLPKDDADAIDLALPLDEDEVRALSRVTMLACGTSWHAGLIGKFFMERLARVFVDVDYASEYRYRSEVAEHGTLAIGITQSGETADTLAAMRAARDRGAHTLAITNMQGSQITRLAECTLLTHAGPEIGVASTKAFTTQLTLLLLVALRVGEIRGTVDADERAQLIAALRRLPAQLERLRRLEPRLEELARRFQHTKHALYLGRGPLYPVALEGALKLKEISYIHAEGYPAGEMKHGPIALIDRDMPVIGMMPDDDHRARTLSNLQEAAARDGRLIAFVTEGDTGLDTVAEHVIGLPKTHPLLVPFLYTVPLQVFAYHAARLRGCDVDKPRNLAKSVTVE